VRRNQWRYLTTDEAVQAALTGLRMKNGCGRKKSAAPGQERGGIHGDILLTQRP